MIDLSVEKAKEIVQLLEQDSLNIVRLKELIIELAYMVDDEENKDE